MRLELWGMTAKRTINRRRLLHCRKGNVAIEFGFMVPVFVLLALAGVELSRLAIEWSRITHAASAGALYGMQDQTNAADITGMEQAARDDASDTTNSLIVTARTFCQCLGVAAEIVCTTNCTDGKYPPMFVEVRVEEPLSAVMPYLNLPPSYALEVVNVSRVR